MRDVDLNQNMVAKIPIEINEAKNYNMEFLKKDSESIIICHHIVNEFNEKVVEYVDDTSLLMNFVHSFIY